MLLLLAGLIGLAAVFLTGVRLSLLRIGKSLSTMQVVVHEVFRRLGARTGRLMTGMSPTAGEHIGLG